MVEIEIMPSAIQDIKSMIAYVRDQSVQNAENLRSELKDKLRSLNKFPERGRLVKEIQNPLIREIKLHHLRIIYRCLPEKVQVLTIFHSARLLVNNPHFKDLK